jgi:vitamin K-dependent gamma-carboxylase
LFYDATIVPLLLWPRSRRVAYALVLIFHGLTWVFFEIGMFPFIMAVATTSFFDAAWPRRWLSSKVMHAINPSPLPVAAPVLMAAVLWCAFQATFPLRCQLMGGQVLWDEAGMRFSWRVMVREKSGSLSYRVTLPSGRVVLMSPHDVLSHRQANEMIGQPDMVLQLAHHIRDDFGARGVAVAVYADAMVALNGRNNAPFVDPAINLANVSDGLGKPSWILPAPTFFPRPSWRR